MGKTVLRLPRQGFNSNGTIEIVHVEILLSPAGRMPELAFASLKV